jgi:hypothetical protein
MYNRLISPLISTFPLFPPPPSSLHDSVRHRLEDTNNTNGRHLRRRRRKGRPHHFRAWAAVPVRRHINARAAFTLRIADNANHHQPHPLIIRHPRHRIEVVDDVIAAAMHRPYGTHARGQRLGRERDDEI